MAAELTSAFFLRYSLSFSEQPSYVFASHFEAGFLAPLILMISTGNAAGESANHQVCADVDDREVSAWKEREV